MFEKYIRTILDSTLECPYYLVDMETHEIVYMNNKGCEVLGISRDSYGDKLCYELLYEQKEPCGFCNKKKLMSDQFIHSEVRIGGFQGHPYRQSTLVEHNGNPYRLELASTQPLTLPNIHDLSEKPTFEQSMVYCTTTLLGDNDIHVGLQELVNISCGFYSGTQSVFLEIDRKSLTFQQSYVCSTEYKSSKKIGAFHQTPADLFGQWSNSLLLEKVVVVTNVAKEVNNDTFLYQVLKKNKITSFILAPIMQGDELVAVLMIENPTEEQMDLRLIRSIILFFQQGLQKRSMLLELKSLYEHDPITGFFNHKKYLEQLELMLTTPPEQLGVVFIDLRTMKKNVEENGYLFGDETVQQAAAVMESFFTEPFYRVDEFQFVCFVPNMNHDQFVHKVDSLRIETLLNDKGEFSVGYSWETGIDDIYAQLEDTDQLMRQEYDMSPQYSSLNKDDAQVSVQKDLLNAIESQEFEVYLQPKVHLKDKKVVGAEALARRKVSEEDSLLYPAIFVQLYEDQAIIRHLDLYVVEHVCKILASWLAYGIEIPVSVNFSRVTLTEFGIVDTICEICDIYKIPHHLLVIEFTERIAMMNEKAYNQIAEEFEKKGFLLSLDDFGVAYSNLITLAKINIDEIKIDKKLIKDMENDDKTQIILKSIIEMCNVMESITPLAEGVETEFQADKLLEFGCVYGQGNYFSPPVPSHEFYQQFLMR